MTSLKTQYHEEQTIDPYYEIGVDEAGRGPLFGRLYVAAVVLPKEGEFSHERMKDSKKFHSKKKIRDVANYIKEHALAWSIQYIEPDIIDQINIRQAVFRGMHSAIDNVMTTMQQNEKYSIKKPFLLIDGNDFQSKITYDEAKEEMVVIPHVTIEGGDNTYSAIAAASILAKVAHDEYIHDLCQQYPILIDRYGLHTNVGYGTKRHLDGIRQYGITQWHRRSYGICATATVTQVTNLSITEEPVPDQGSGMV
jgi:ribonuclease HII